MGLLLVLVPARWARADDGDGSSSATAPPPAVDWRLIEGAAFYEILGRPDLVTAYETRHGLKIVSRVVGGVTLGIGALIWLVESIAYSSTLPDSCTSPGSSPSCPADSSTYWKPDIAMGVGLALIVAPAFFSDDPVSDEEKAELARASGRFAPLPMRLNLCVAPANAGAGGVALLSGRF